MSESKLSHVNDQNQASMVDVSSKKVTRREATAQCVMDLPQECMQIFSKDANDWNTQKGPVLHTARLAGVMAVKQTSHLIPLCHPLPIEDCQIDIRVEEAQVLIEVTVVTTSKTGVEMEALTGATVTALTIYDMLKALSHQIVIRETQLLAKTGGKSDYHA